MTGTGHEVLAIVGDELIGVIVYKVFVIPDPNPIPPLEWVKTGSSTRMLMSGWGLKMKEILKGEVAPPVFANINSGE